MSPQHSRLSKIEDKIDKMFDKVSTIDSTLGLQHEVLKEHIRRTEILEQRIEPIEKRFLMLLGSIKVIGAGITVISLIAAIAEILSYLKR